MSHRTLRRIWFKAACELLKRRDSAAGEAFRNALRRYPPTHWRTGVPVIRIGWDMHLADDPTMREIY